MSLVCVCVCMHVVRAAWQQDVNIGDPEVRGITLVGCALIRVVVAGAVCCAS